MTRLLALAALAVGLFGAPASAMPECGALVGTNCWDGGRACRIYVGPTGTCTRPA